MSKGILTLCSSLLFFCLLPEQSLKLVVNVQSTIRNAGRVVSSTTRGRCALCCGFVCLVLIFGHTSQQWLDIRGACHHVFGPLWLLLNSVSHHESNALIALKTAAVVTAAAYSLIAGAQE